MKCDSCVKTLQGIHTNSPFSIKLLFVIPKYVDKLTKLVLLNPEVLSNFDYLIHIPWTGLVLKI